MLPNRKDKNITFSRVAILSLIAYFPLGYIVGTIHELGHHLICVSEGYESRIYFDLQGGHQLCRKAPSNMFVYNAIGGVYGLIASGSIIGIWLVKRKYLYLLVGGIVWAIDSSSKIVLEGFFNSIYKSPEFVPYNTAFQIITIVGVTLYFARRAHLQEKAKEATS